MNQKLDYSSIYVVVSFLLIPSVQATEEESSTVETVEAGLEEMVDSQLKSLNMDELTGFWEDIMDEYGGFFQKARKEVYMILLKGTRSFL